MKYLKVDWLHDFSTEPIVIYSELDEESNEKRKLELFRDGIIQYATEQMEFGSIGLSIEPIPPLEEINSDPQFNGKYITKEEFEEVWKKYASTR